MLHLDPFTQAFAELGSKKRLVEAQRAIQNGGKYKKSHKRKKVT